MKVPSVEALAAGRPIRPSKFGHIVLRTVNMPRLRDWYLQVLAGSVSYQNELVSFLTYDDEHHRLGIVQFPNLSLDNAGCTGLEHLSYSYAELPSLLATYRRLKAAAIEPFWTINHGPTISLYYRDPDGNKVELQYDVFDTIEAANEFIARHYPENFMGIIFDPEKLIADYESGVPIAELVRRPTLPQGMTPWDMHRP